MLNCYRVHCVPTRNPLNGPAQRCWTRNISAVSLKSNSPWPRIVPIAIAFGAVTGAALYLFYPDESRSAPTSAKTPFSPSHFTPATVTSIESSGPDTKLLQLVIPPNLLPSRQSANSSFAPIWSVYIKDDDIQIERPYTPLEGVDEQGRMLFWIKRYPKGEVSQWLHSKGLSEQVALRGPMKTWPWEEGRWDEVVMISGGTGVTPFYQLFHTLISRQPDTPLKTRFTLLHSSRTPADLPPPRILERLSAYAAQNPGTFRLRVFVDSLEGLPIPPNVQNLKVGRIGKAAIQQCLDSVGYYGSWWDKLCRKPEASTPSHSRILFLVCGPESMISAISGPFGRNFSQGPVGGVLGEMGFRPNEVWKL